METEKGFNIEKISAQDIEIKELKTRISNLEAENTELKAKILINPVSKCLNRNYFEKFKEEIFDPDKDHNKLAIVVIDVNNLKKINDTQGHQAGDLLIKNTADFGKSHFREEDIIIHLGGDEFTILARDLRQEEGSDVDNFKKNVASSIAERIMSQSPVSLAFGIVIYDKYKYQNLMEALHEADLLMLKNKEDMRAGRSCQSCL